MAGNSNSGKKLDTLITNALRVAVNRPGADGRKEAARIAERVVAMASTGEDDRVALDAVRFISDRLEGKPKQAMDVTSNDQTLAPVLNVTIGGIESTPSQATGHSAPDDSD